MTLSVIVPIYRVEPYLKQCVESILAQTDSNLELILVDDGSPDGCPEICDSYARQDARVKVIHQENHGLVTARRVGLEAASGDYVTFVDGDDWIETDLYSRVSVFFGQNPDMVVTGMVEDRNGELQARENSLSSGLYRGEGIGKLHARAIMAEAFYTPGVIPSLCNKYIRRELYLKYDPAVDPGIRMGEDAAVSYPLLFHSRCIVINNEIQGYHYRMVEDSMSQTYNDQYFVEVKKLVDSLDQSLAGFPEALRQLPYYLLFLLENGLVWIISRVSGKALKEMVQDTGKVIIGFRLPERLAGLDMAVLTVEQQKKAEALRQNRPLCYVVLELLDKIRHRQ